MVRVGIKGGRLRGPLLFFTTAMEVGLSTCSQYKHMEENGWKNGRK
jgi:hypothetical protein